MRRRIGVNNLAVASGSITLVEVAAHTLTDMSQLGTYFQVADTGNDARLLFNPDPASDGRSAAVAMLSGVGPDATLNTLIGSGVLKISWPELTNWPSGTHKRT